MTIGIHRLCWQTVGRRVLHTLLILLFLAGTWAQPVPPRLSASGTRADAPTIQPDLIALPASRIFTDVDGLPQNSVMAMTTDADGYLWVGTQDGAARYDGNQWQRFDLPEKGSSNWVRTMLLARDGRLWFGTNADGVFIWHQGSFVQHYHAGQAGFPHNTVTALAEVPEPDGRTILWAGTAGGGLTCFDGKRWETFTQANAGLPSDAIRALLVTERAGQPVLWVATSHGLVEWQDRRVQRLYSTANGQLPSDDIRAMVEVREPDGARVLWAGFANHGVAMYRDGQWRMMREDFNGTKQIRSLAATYGPDQSVTLWVGTNGGGLAAYHAGRWTLYNTDTQTIPNSEVSSIHQTQTGNGPPLLWVGTNGGGLARLRFGAWHRLHFPTDLIPLVGVKSLLEYVEPDGSRAFWIGTRNHGAACFRQGRWEVFQMENGPLPSRFVSCMLKTEQVSNGPAVWLGTATGGLARLQNRQWTIFNREQGSLPDDGIWSLLETTDDAGTPQLLVGTEKGVAVWKQGQWSRFPLEASGITSEYVTAMLAIREPDGSQCLWFGTFGGGIARLHRGRWTLYNRANGTLPSDIVRSLHLLEKDGTRTLWAGTYAGVAIGALQSGEVQWHTLSDSTEPALPNNVVYEVRHDRQGRVYLFTNRGVARLTPSQTQAWRLPTLETFTTEDGLPSNECNGGAALCDSEGRLWAGTIAGLTMFDDRLEITRGETVPPRIVRILINGQEQRLTTNLVLSHDQNEVSFEYELLNFFRNAETQYSTQLIGYESQPTPWVLDRRRTFASLPAGTYAFRIRSRDYLGTVQEITTASLTIRRPWWARWWAFGLYALAFVALGLGIMQWRVYLLRKRTLELEAKVAERTAALAALNQNLAEKNDQLVVANRDLARKNDELAEAQRRTDLVFSALTKALPGTVLDGKYQLDVKIGTGGFGVVYEATQLALNRKVAVKVFRPAAGNDSPQALERFRQEGISACRVNHPNAVAILDSGVSLEGIAYIVMELLRGYTLTDELRRYGSLSPARCAEILIPVLDVLDTAHAEGVIHRDIKPDNIFLHQTKDSEIVKVVDFGVAKLVGEDTLKEQTISVLGAVVGTAAYLAPERINHLSYDGKSDVYAVGVTLYQMLTGQLPFDSASGFVGIALQHLTHRPRPVQQVVPDIPAALSDIVAQALEKDPALRPTARDMAVRLAEYLAQTPVLDSRGFPKVVPNSFPSDDDPYSAPTLIGP
ncbi:protein kinase [Chloracidobacterium validum]|uniref:Protein kinase n=1 Tax=Chloracidobacterium validum TaxID=2821543 RepID=A0ABX8B591_9BACT|nr:protein kinase [Chloracidobacterium validum]QUW02142.1 protein kinase [Chloracidobacterium validum]